MTTLPSFTAQVEVFSEILDEMKPGFAAHYDKLSLNAGRTPLDPDYDTYLACEKQGRLLVVTLRDWRGALAGYWILFVGPALHSKGVLTAIMDLWHIQPEYVGGTAPLRLIKAVKAELVRRGVQRWFAGENIDVPCGRLFEAVGMERVECTYSEWLGGASSMVTGAIIGGTAIMAGGSLLAGQAQAKGAEKAGDLAFAGTQAAIGEQRRQFDLARSDLEPYRLTGANALQQYAALYGISGRDPGTTGQEFIDQQVQIGTRPPSGGGVAGGGAIGVGDQGYDLIGGDTVIGGRAPAGGGYDPGGPIFETRSVANPEYDPNGAFLSNEEQQAARDRFLTTPGYKFRFEEGQRAVERAGSARGSLGGGRTARELVRYGEGLASSEFENYANRLAQISGFGQGAATTGAGLGVQTGANIARTQLAGSELQGQAALAAGTARASGYAGAAKAIGGGVNNYLAFG